MDIRLVWQYCIAVRFSEFRNCTVGILKRISVLRNYILKYYWIKRHNTCTPLFPMAQERLHICICVCTYTHTYMCVFKRIKQMWQMVKLFWVKGIVWVLCYYTLSISLKSRPPQFLKNHINLVHSMIFISFLSWTVSWRFGLGSTFSLTPCSLSPQG